MFRLLIVAVVIFVMFGCGTMFGDKDKDITTEASAEVNNTSGVAT